MKCITTTHKDLINIFACHKSTFPNALSSQMRNNLILKMAGKSANKQQYHYKCIN